MQDTNNLLGGAPSQEDEEESTTMTTTRGLLSSSTVTRGRRGRDFLHRDGFVARPQLGRLMQGLGKDDR